MPEKQPTTTIEGIDAVRQYDDEKKDRQPMTEAEKQMHEEELSFYSNSENDFGDDNIWGLLSGVGGNIYEWYVDGMFVQIVHVQKVHHVAPYAVAKAKI